MTGAPRPPEVEFTELSHDEIEALLTRNNVGRLAFAFHDRVDIQPIHFSYERGWLYGRTSPGNKVSTLRHNQWVAFEVDEVSDIFDWKSVVIHGSFWLLRPQGTPHAVDVWKHAASLLTKIVPGTLTEDDPVAFRQVLFRIAITDVRGRSSRIKS
jgi:Predicted flavin-nucleotide-binding protein